MAGQHMDGAFASLRRDRGLLANTRNFCRFVIARLLEPLINAAARWHGIVLFLKTRIDLHSYQQRDRFLGGSDQVEFPQTTRRSARP
jgi:hypothetical protein